MNTMNTMDGSCTLQSAESLQGIAPGQFGVIYTSDRRLCIGSGEISLT